MEREQSRASCKFSRGPERHPTSSPWVLTVVKDTGVSPDRALPDCITNPGTPPLLEP